MHAAVMNLETNRIVLSRRLKLGLVSIVLVSVLVGTISALQSSLTEQPSTRSNGEYSEEPRFSVRWMGFCPTYNNQTPDYYICINDLKDDYLTMHIAMQIQNFENSSYWFLIESFTAPPTGWTVTTYYIGFINIDQTITFTYSNINRTKPTSIPEGRITESINLVVRAYHDSSYTNLYSQDNFTVQFHFLDLTSPAWTMLHNDNFDDGTAQGWHAQKQGSGGYAGPEPYTYYRSWPYSLRVTNDYRYDSYCNFYKDFVTNGSLNEVYLVYSILSGRWTQHDRGAVYINEVVYFQSDVSPSTGTWYQVAIPLPLNQSSRVRIPVIEVEWLSGTYSAYLDDVYVVGK